jgi:hypothetical protein
LLDRILGDRGRTWHAVLLLLAGAFSVGLVLVPVLIVASLFGMTGAAVLSGLGTLAAAGYGVHRRGARRRP